MKNIKKIIQEQIQLYEKKEVIKDKGSWEIVSTSNELWLIPKSGKSSDRIGKEMDSFLKKLSTGLGIGIKKTVDMDLDSRRVILKNKLSDEDMRA